ANLVITPNLGKYTLLDFTKVNAISDLGYEAAKQNSAALEKYALDESAWQAYLAAREARRRTTIPTPTALTVDGTKEQNARSISRTLNSNLGQPIDPDKLGTQLNEIRGEGRYSSLNYTVDKNLEENRLMIHVRDKSYGPALLIPIVQYHSSNVSNVKFSLGGRFTIFDVGSYGSELRIDAIVGSDDFLGAEYFRPLGRKGFFVAPRAAFNSSATDLFANGDRVAEYRQHRVAAGMDA